MDRRVAGHSHYRMPSVALDSSATSTSAPRPQAPRPETLYETHFTFVWRNLRRMGVSDDSLEDAAQDVFLTVFQRWETYDPNRARVETWLFGILLRVASYYRRTLRRRLARIVPWSKEGTRESIIAGGEVPAELVAKRQAAQLLDRLLDGISPDKRALLVLVDVEQCSVPEAAQILNINLNTAYWRLRQARTNFERGLARVRASEQRRSGGEADQ